MTPDANNELIKRADASVQTQLKYAFNLADRGAVYSSNARFIDCLRSIAKILDTNQRVAAHEQALFVGLTALREADEFAQIGPSAGPNLGRLVVVHKTPVLKGVDVSRVAPAEALRLYYAFAQKQLVFASGNVPAASQALYGMARIEAFRSARDGLTTSSGSAKALLLHQAALAADAYNYAAANEIGVILARNGRLDAARKVLEHSASVKSVPETWHNLSEVYAKLGDQTKAESARRASEALTQTQHQESREASSEDELQPAAVRWVDAEKFAASGADPDCNFTLRRGIASGSTPTIAGKPSATPANAKQGGSKIGRAWSHLRDKINFSKHGSEQPKPQATEADDSQGSRE